MELWIRSQDKKDLINVSEYLSIEETNFSEDIEYVKNPNKRPFFIECSNCILGFYATEERALEVLDEIQHKINLINLGHDFGSPMIDLNNPTYIYEMPKE